MRRLLRILPLLVLLTLVTAVAAHRGRPASWGAAPLRDADPAALPPLPAGAADATVAGIVRGPDGTPLAEALVLVETDEPRWAYTDSGGRFRVERVGRGALPVSVWAREHEVSDFTLEAPAEDLELTLTTSLTTLPDLPALLTTDLALRVAPPFADQGLAGYEVLLLPARPVSRFGEPVPRRATVGADRGARFEALLHGEYRVVVLPPWAAGGEWPNLCAPEARRLEHGAGPRTQELELPLSAGEIRGTITDPAGRFLEGALCLVSVDALPERVWPAGRSGADGSFLVRDLPPEVYRLEVRAGSGTLSVPVEVPPRATVEVDLPPLDPTAR